MVPYQVYYSLKNFHLQVLHFKYILSFIWKDPGKYILAQHGHICFKECLKHVSIEIKITLELNIKHCG
jgi:hypothetical protein